MRQEVNIYCDGGGNKGTIGCWGWIAYGPEGAPLEKQGGLLPKKASNNDAEYTAVLQALKWAWDNYEVVTVREVFTDSYLVVQQVNGTWKCNSPRLDGFRVSVHQLMHLLEVKQLTWVSREQNTEADKVGRMLREEAVKNDR
jgi:ribonuclease HI